MEHWGRFSASMLLPVVFVAGLGCSGSGGDAATPTTPGTDPLAASVSVPLGGNAYLTGGADGSETITDAGLQNWTSSTAVCSVYVRVAQAGQLTVGLKAKVLPAGSSSSAKVIVNGTPFTVELSGADAKGYAVGTVPVSAPGYVKVDLQGLTRKGANAVEVSDLLVSGSATATNLLFANDPANFYWSRRGPSVHMGYTLPTGNVEYFYNEVTVPVGQDAIGMYAMANGFGEGYFGIQVNSPTERRVLFSVWDPASGGKTSVTKLGTDVHGGSFGGEGTGGQTYLVYPWVAGNTYRFLTRVHPDGAGATDYTCWFYAPETGTWKFISSQHRPATTTWYTNAHSFLECFDTEVSYIPRTVLYGPQWARKSDGTWVEATNGRFTCDATGSNKQRADYAGGLQDGRFFLHHCGFFANTVSAYSTFNRPATGVPPTVDVNTLPQE